MKLRGQHCRCGACGEYFNSTGMFDRHRVGKYQPMGRRCLTPAEMLAKGYSVSSAGFWIRQAHMHRERISGDQNQAATTLPGAA